MLRACRTSLAACRVTVARKRELSMLDLSAEGSGLAQARARVRESMQPRLNFEGWKLGEDKAAADAARSAGKILDLGDAELRALAANLAA